MKILTDGASPVVVYLNEYASNCSPDPKAVGSYICTASLNVPAGNHVFTVTTYDSSTATGHVLSTNTTGTVYVKPTGATTIAIALEGVVQYVVLQLQTTNPPIGRAATIALTAILEDFDQNLIVGPAPYDNPVTLLTTDLTDGALSKTVLNSPADVSGLTASYTGAKVAYITYSATASGLAAANVTNTILAPGSLVWRLYVTDEGFDSFTVFNLDDHTAIPMLINSGGFFPNGLAVDASGKLYVTDAGGFGFQPSIDVLDTNHGYGVLPAITGGGLNGPGGIAVDAGKLYVSNGGGNVGTGAANTVSIFDTLHGNTPLPEIAGGGLNGPAGVAVGANGKLYVTNSGSNSVSVFDTVHGNAPLPPITGGGLNGPYGVAAGANGKLYVANSGGEGNSVSVFDTAHGNVALPAITGGGLAKCMAAAIDSTGKLYVTNVAGSGIVGNGQTVSVFDTAHGNAPLPQVFGGPNGVGLNGAYGVAVHGTLK